MENSVLNVIDESTVLSDLFREVFRLDPLVFNTPEDALELTRALLEGEDGVVSEEIIDPVTFRHYTSLPQDHNEESIENLSTYLVNVSQEKENQSRLTRRNKRVMNKLLQDILKFILRYPISSLDESTWPMSATRHHPFS